MPARFTASDLKRIAMGTMLVDHAAVALLYRYGYVVVPFWNAVYTAMRLIGRVAFPLFAFLLVEGALHTRNWKKYALRLFLAAVVSEVPFDLVSAGTVWAPAGQNTLWLLLIGLLTIKAAEAAEAAGRKHAGSPGTQILVIAIVLAGMGVPFFLRADYGPMGLFFLLSLYYFRGNIQQRTLAGGAILFLFYRDFYGLAAWIAFYFINRYNGEKGQLPALAAYVFYPAHLLILYAVGVLIHGIHF